MDFTQNDWGQRDIINKTKILNRWGSDTIHGTIKIKYQKYLSENVLDKVDKLTYGRLLNTPLHDAYIITIHKRITTLEDIKHKQKE